MVDFNCIYTGDCIEVMKTWPENFVDTIITDPPYGLDFMGKDWDGDVPGVHFWNQMIRICKPGAMLLAFGGTRTWHHLAMAIEKASWQIRDCMMWLYGSGFPKSHNLHGKFEGWGTALKPAWEPIIVAMKPLDGTFAENADKHGVAGLNIDGSRIESSEQTGWGGRPSRGYSGGLDHVDAPRPVQGRWPANLILDEEAAAMLDGQSGGTGENARLLNRNGEREMDGWGFMEQSKGIVHAGFGGASRFFYVAKADRAERNEGCDELPRQTVDDGRQKSIDNPFLLGETERRNTHPTVKPLDLMKYLCNLTRTPTGGIVLDPFAGSGTTLWAAECHNRPWIGIEMNPEYVAIAEARIASERAQIKMAI